MEDKYFIKKGDESGKLYEHFSPQWSEKSKRTYTSIGGGFDFNFFSDEEVEPAPTHLVVAARLKGDLDGKDIQFIIDEARMAIQARKFQVEQEYEDYRFKQQLLLEEFEFNRKYSQIQKGIV